MTPQDLIDTYSQFSDEELVDAYHHRSDYTSQAQNALASVIEDRGGLEHLLESERSKAKYLAESERIRQEVRRLQAPDVDTEFLNKMIHSEIIGEMQKEAMIKQTYDEIIVEWEDQKVKPRTIVGGVLAAGIASVIGGILWGLQMMWSGKIFVIFLVGLVLLCYGFIQLFTKQSHKNTAVVVLTFISVAVALVIGQLMYEVFGRQ